MVILLGTSFKNDTYDKSLPESLLRGLIFVGSADQSLAGRFEIDIEDPISDADVCFYSNHDADMLSFAQCGARHC